MVSVLILCALTTVLVAVDYLANYGEIRGGVVVDDVELGGHTPLQAREMLEERASTMLGEVRITGPETFTGSAEELGMNFDVAATVDKAYAVGRQGNILERLGERIESALGTVRVSPVVSYEPGGAREGIRAIANELDASPRNGSVSLAGQTVQVGEARVGYRMNVAATRANVEAAIEGMTGEAEIVGKKLEPDITTQEARAAADRARQALSGPAVTLSAGDREWKLSPAEIQQALTVAPRGGELQVGLDGERLQAGLADMYEALNKAPNSASYEFKDEKVVVNEGSSGKAVEREELLGSIESGIVSGERAFEVPVRTVRPELTTARAKELKPTELIGEYRTSFQFSDVDSPKRIENLRTASKAIRGTTLAPGEVFSANDILAPLDYNRTKVFNEGRVELADGGGLCQVASTVYMAVNYAGLDVVERHQHYAKLDYIRPGFDATVWFGTGPASELDFRFKNTSSGYVLIREYVRDGYIHAEVWGQPTGKKVKMDSERIGGDSDFAKWKTYKKVEKDGEVLFDGALHTDTYQAIEKQNGKEVPPKEVRTAPIRP